MVVIDEKSYDFFGSQVLGVNGIYKGLEFWEEQ